MRIVHVIEDLLPSSGGPPAVVLNLAQQQSEEGDHVTVVCANGAGCLEARCSLKSGQARVGAQPTLAAPDSGEAPSRFVRRALEKSKPDIVHLHGLYCFALNTAARWCDLKAVPYVCSTHGMLHPRAIAKGYLKKRAYFLLFPQVLRGSKWLLTLNSEEAAYTQVRFNKNTQIIENGVRCSDFSAATSSEFFALYPDLEQRPYALFIGRLHHVKGIDRLVHAYAVSLHLGLEEDLVVIGPDEGASSEIQKAIRQHGLENRVHMLPPLYGAARASAIAGCRLFVHRPRYEGFGLAVVEAMAAAKPVVTTKQCHLESAFRAGVISVVEDTESAFAAGMIAASLDMQRENVSGRGAAVWVRANLDWPRVSARIKSLYEAE